MEINMFHVCLQPYTYVCTCPFIKKYNNKGKRTIALCPSHMPME